MALVLVLRHIKSTRTYIHYLALAMKMSSGRLEIDFLKISTRVCMTYVEVTHFSRLYTKIDVCETTYVHVLHVCTQTSVHADVEIAWHSRATA